MLKDPEIAQYLANIRKKSVERREKAKAAKQTGHLLEAETKVVELESFVERAVTKKL